MLACSEQRNLHAVLQHPNRATRDADIRDRALVARSDADREHRAVHHDLGVRRLDDDVARDARILVDRDVDSTHRKPVALFHGVAPGHGQLRRGSELDHTLLRTNRGPSFRGGFDFTERAQGRLRVARQHAALTVLGHYHGTRHFRDRGKHCGLRRLNAAELAPQCLSPGRAWPRYPSSKSSACAAPRRLRSAVARIERARAATTCVRRCSTRSGSSTGTTWLPKRRNMSSGCDGRRDPLTTAPPCGAGPRNRDGGRAHVDRAPSVIARQKR